LSFDHPKSDGSSLRESKEDKINQYIVLSRQNALPVKTTEGVLRDREPVAYRRR